MSDGRRTKARGEIHIAIAVGVDHVAARRFGPHDRIVRRARGLAATSATCGEGGRLSLGKRLDQRHTPRTQQGSVDLGRQCTEGFCVSRLVFPRFFVRHAGLA